MTFRVSSKSLSNCNDIQSFDAIDVYKFISAILIVAVHVRFWKGLLPLGLPAKPSVPFFFMCTGFLIFRRTSPESFSPKIPINFAKKACRQYLLWTLIYSPMILTTFWKNKHQILKTGLRFMRNFLFTGSVAHLWYVTAVIFAVLLTAILLKHRIRIENILFIAFLFYLVGLLPQSYWGILKHFESIPPIWTFAKAMEKIIVTTRNGLFYGFLFVTMGALYAYRPIQIKFWKAIVAYVFFMMLLGLEIKGVNHLGWNKSNDMSFFMVPASFFLFYIVSHIRLNPSKVYPYLRSLSSLVYFSHWGIRNLVNRFYPSSGSAFVRFLIVCSTSILVSMAIVKLSRYPKMQFLKVLI